MFAVNVAINLPIKNLFKQYTYLVPDELSYLDRGWRVVVPFGKQTVEGFVVERTPLPSDIAMVNKLKLIQAALGAAPWFDEEMLATAEWLAQYYLCSLAEAMRLFVPGKTSIKRQAVRDNTGRLLYYTYAERLQEKTLLAYTLSEAGREAYEAGTLAKRAKVQHYALQLLTTATEAMTVSELANQGVSAAIMRQLVQRGLVLAEQKRILRNSYERHIPPEAPLHLTQEQDYAVERLVKALTSDDKKKTFLLQGITGSGKTEVYLRTTAEALAQGKQVMMLVPEIALTAQLVRRFQAWFGDNIAVAHSKLSQNERGDVWYKMRTGKARVLIGVRSAVFAPFENLGLVIIDEEHETSYKQEERPNYHARTVAQARCEGLGIPLVLGSATPDVVTYHRAMQGEYHHLRLTERPTGNQLPKVEIVDMRAELASRNFNVLSRSLQSSLVHMAAQGEQSIILLNRRGFSTFVMCRDCGATINCEHCAVALVYHSAGEDMRCHYCGQTAKVPTECPQCHSKRIKFFGTGTQKAQSELAQLPKVKVLRMDQDTTTTKFAHEEILHQFTHEDYNVLIGTQMVAKGHDIPNVTLVGVLSADSALNLPDYRASERAFALLTQAAGRAGRGDKPGHVILQTYDPDNAIIQLAAKQDYDTFATQEIAGRRMFFFPPFAQMLKLSVWDKDEAAAQALAKRVVLYLQQLQLAGQLTEELQLNGPFPALVAKIRDFYRFNVLIKAPDLKPVKQALWNSEFKECKNLYFDVDPLSVI